MLRQASESGLTTEPSTRQPGNADIPGWPVGAPVSTRHHSVFPRGTDGQGSPLAVVSYLVLYPENPGLPGLC